MSEQEPSPDHAAPSPQVRESLRRYWRANVKIMIVLLGIWFVAGPVLGILVADKLNEFKLGGFPLGFWMAQQGSIIIFVLLILIYAILLNRLDRRHHDELIELGYREEQA